MEFEKLRYTVKVSPSGKAAGPLDKLKGSTLDNKRPPAGGQWQRQPWQPSNQCRECSSKRPVLRPLHSR